MNHSFPNNEFFAKKIDLANKVEMIQFLRSHRRYYTASSVQRSTTYANLVKVHSLGLTAVEQQAAYAVIEVAETYQLLDEPMIDFQRQFNDSFQMGFNGRSGGHLVVLKAERRVGANGIVYAQALTSALDEDADYEAWSKGELRDRVELVTAFDQACDSVRSVFQAVLREFDVCNEAVVITKQVRVLRPKNPVSAD